MEQQVVTNDGTPPPDPDAEKYTALAKELGIEPEGQEPPAPEPQPEPKPESEPPSEPAHVPRAEHENIQKALREAREQARAANDQLSRFMRIVEDARTQRPQPEAKKEEGPKLPDRQEDPIGYFEARIAQIEGQIGEARRGGQMTEQQLQSWQQQQQVLAAVQASEADILNPKSQAYKADYGEACEHLEGQRIRELDRMYPDGSPYAMHFARQSGFQDTQQLKLAILNHDRHAVAIQALQMGVSPAAFYYQLAEDRGYKAKPNGKTQEPERGKQQIEAAKRGQGAALSISGGNAGRKGAEDMSITDLSQLFIDDPEAADKVWDQMAKAGRLG
jgi:hypothetical protein